MRLGEHFMKHQITDEEQIQKALEIQAKSGGKIGEILLAMANMRAIDYYKVIAKHYDIKFVDLLKSDIDLDLLNNENKERYYNEMTIPISKEGDCYTIATADPGPETFKRIQDEFGENTNIVCTSKFDVMWSLQKIFKTDYLESSIYELSNKHEKLSAKYIPPVWLRVIYLLPFFALIFLLMFDLKLGLLVVNSICLVGLSLIITFKVGLSLIGLMLSTKATAKEISIDEKELPIFSILIPLYKENHATLNSLFTHIQKLIYPKHKLDIKVLLEEDDNQTIDIIKKMHLPSYIEFIYVPAGEPRTKAKACNYGFKFVRGKYLCLYDAEDQPNPDQLIKVVQLFKESEKDKEKVACIQCKLNFYNSRENWLTKMFTIEYTYWFDLLLPALAYTRIPIPLGGTSNHFQTEMLKEVFAWDPFNVTEDADLGLRLSRLGYITKILDSTTYEEANCQLINWIKQRTRWVKGYMQTYIVHMRNPFELWYKIGTKGFIGFQLFIGGTVLSNLTNIPMWIICALVFLVPGFNVSYYFPGIVYDMAIINLIVGTGGIILLNLLGVIERKQYHLIISTLTSPVYWMLMSVASYRSLYQLIFNPSYWDKTQHGISNVFANKKNLGIEQINIAEMSSVSGIKFGTSGLRAYNHLLTDKVCYEFAAAFLQHLKLINKLDDGSKVMIAGDHRQNTDHILKVIAKAITDLGYVVEYIGKIPTPALAYFSQINKTPGIMVTGSHIPADMNGIKFYSREGEITKEDERGILSQTVNIDPHLFDEDGNLPVSDLYMLPLSFDAMEAFTNRYISFLPDNALKNLRIGLYQHSSVAADMLSNTLKQLGAEVILFGATQHFYSVDTESLSLSDKQIVAHHLKTDDLDVVVSTDGDADRPLLSDENGNWIPGDMLGLLTAIILDAEYVVTPISSNTSVERVHLFKEVIRTKIGSPYVIEQMQALASRGANAIIGYEANGGVLIGSNFSMNGHHLSALPTRDSFLPILSILSYVNQHNIPLSEFVKKYSLSYTESSSIKGIEIEKTKELLAFLRSDNNIEKTFPAFFDLSQQVEKVNDTDGMRVYLNDGSVIHLRGSGNAPELRCYTEAPTKEQATALNEHVMMKIKSWSDSKVMDE